jgi:hypothetical protein
MSRIVNIVLDKNSGSYLPPPVTSGSGGSGGGGGGTVGHIPIFTATGFTESDLISSTGSLQDTANKFRLEYGTVPLLRFSEIDEDAISWITARGFNMADADGNVFAYIGKSGDASFTALQLSTGGADGFVLTSDSSGNASWQPSATVHDYVYVFHNGTSSMLANGSTTFGPGFANGGNLIQLKGANIIDGSGNITLPVDGLWEFEVNFTYYTLAGYGGNALMNIIHSGYNFHSRAIPDNGGGGAVPYYISAKMYRMYPAGTVSPLFITANNNTAGQSTFNAIYVKITRVGDYTAIGP